MKKVLFAFATVALAAASAASKTYSVTISQPAYVNGTQLKPGDYKLEVEGNQATLRLGKTVVAAPAKVETNQRKYDGTQVTIDNAATQPKLQEIRVGGTTMRVVFDVAAGGQ